MGGGGNNRRTDNRFDRGGFGGGMNRPNPWGGDNMGGNFRQGGGNSGGMNNDVLSLANSLVNNLLRNQNHPPSLLDLPNRGGYGGGRDGRFNDRMGGFNRNMPNRRNGPPGARQKNDKLGAIKGGIRKRNPVSSAKKVLAKNAKDDASPDANNSNLSAKNVKKESKYADVPNVMFYCHMCKKHMWDAVSFENHVKGRTHMMMRDGVEESYRLRANMIRQEAKIDEQLKTIELERRSRMGKGGKGNRREYCTMCDLHFFGHLSTHRKSDGHLQLKKFLHPRCGDCSQEFPNRIDFDNHMLTPDHMKKAHANKSNKPERRKNALVIYTEEDELKDLREDKPVTKKETDEAEEAMETDETAVEKNGQNGEAKEGEEKEEKEDATEEGKAAEEKPAEAVEPEDVILDVGDEEEVPIEIENRVPKYNCNRKIGPSSIHHVDCFECYICNRFFDTERTVEVHTRTVTHHRNFVKFLNERSNDTKIAQRRAQAALEEIERKKKKLEEIANGEAGEKKDGDETYDPSEETGENDKTGDETMESQDGDEQFEDANQTVKEDVVQAPEPEPEPEPVVEVKASPKPTPQRAVRGRAGRGRRN